MDWYYKLKGDNKNALINNYNINEDTVIISDQVPKPGGGYTRRFAAFDNDESFKNWYLTTSANKTLFETIPGERCQKIYFDIDIKGSEDIDHKKLILNLKECIIEEVKKFNSEISNRDILVFTSTRTNDSDKISYHVILDNFYVKDYRINKEICTRIKVKLPGEFQKYVDVLYSSLQQLRLLFSHKTDCPNRVKVLCKDLTEKTFDQDEELLLSSMICHINDCKYLDVKYDDFFVIEKSINGKKSPIRRKDKQEYNATEINIPPNSYEKLIEIVENKLSDFQIMDTETPSLFHLRRVSSDNPCLECKRFHDNENSFLIVDRYGGVIFMCFRRYYETENVGIKIGEIEVEHEIFSWLDEDFVKEKDEKKLSSPPPRKKLPDGEPIWSSNMKDFTKKTSLFGK